MSQYIVHVQDFKLARISLCGPAVHAGVAAGGRKFFIHVQDFKLARISLLYVWYMYVARRFMQALRRAALRGLWAWQCSSLRSSFFAYEYLLEDGGLRPGAGTAAGVKRQEARIFFSRDKKERKRALARACAHGDNRSAKVPFAM